MPLNLYNPNSIWYRTPPLPETYSAVNNSIILGDNSSQPKSAYDIAMSVQDNNLKTDMLYNLALIDEQRAYNEKMSKSAYQFAVEDMKKAGLNPYLVYSNGGSGAQVLASAITPSSYAPSAYTADQTLKGVRISTAGKVLSSLLNSVSSAFNIGLRSALKK